MKKNFSISFLLLSINALYASDNFESKVSHSNRSKSPVIEMLIQAGVKNNKAVESLTPLIKSIIEHKSDQAKRLARSYSDINKQDIYGNTALHWAVTQNNFALVTRLLDNRTIDINIENNDGFTPLALAVSEDNTPIVALLINNKADVNTRSFKDKTKQIESLKAKNTNSKIIAKLGLTPLMLAAQSKTENYEIIDLLLNANAHPNYESLAINKEGDIKIDKLTGNPCVETAHDIASRCGKKVDFLRDLDQKSLLFIKCIEHNNLKEAMRLLSQNPLYINKADLFGDTALHLAVQHSSKDIVELLLTAGADVNKANDEGNAALALAAANRRWDIVPVLIAAGAQVNQANKAGEIPLHFAACAGSTRVITWLIKAGSDVNKQNAYNLTPLYLADLHHYENIKILLIRAGAKETKSKIFSK